jgi:hypothetical protein
MLDEMAISMKIGIIYSDVFADRLAGHLINDVHFCTSCGNDCSNCRLPLGSHAGDIVTFQEIEKPATEFIEEEPARFLPKIFPAVDVLIPVGLHLDILALMPTFAKIHGIRAVIVPVEDKKWLPFGLQTQLAEDFKHEEIQAAFPRPFCDLHVDPDDAASKSIIREFMDRYKIGRPEIEVDIKHGKIMSGYVRRSQPCGSAYYIVQQLRGEKVFDEAKPLDEKISLAHHSFPCSGAMENDPVLGDSPLHVAGYLARDSVQDAVQRQLGHVDKARFHRDMQEEQPGAVDENPPATREA